MKKKFTILITAALMLLTMMAQPVTALGQTTETKTVTLSEGTFSTDHITWTCADGNITIQQIKGSGSSAVNSNYISAPRVYKGHVLSFVGSNNYTINSISITYSGNYTGNSMTAGTAMSGNTVTDNPTDVNRTWATTSGGTHVVSAVSTAGLSAIYIQNVASATNTQLRPTAISITYTIPSSSNPTISANNVEIDYDATQGSIAYELQNATGNVTAAITSGDWITSIGTITSDTVPFTCSANTAATARTATVTLSFNGANDKVVTITQGGNPDVFITIAEARAQGTGNVVTKGYVTSCVGTTGYIQDATAAICVFGSSLTVGDEIRVAGTLSNYNGLLEITSPTVTVVSSGNTIEPELMTIAEAVASTNQGWYIRIEDATVTNISGSGNSQNTTVKQGENTIVVRGNLSTTVAVNDHISFNGNIGYYNGNQIANPQDVTVLQNNDPTISAENVNIAYNATEGVIEYTVNNPVSGGLLTASTTADWLTIGTVGVTVPFTCTINDAVTARTATVTLTYTYNSTETVTKDVTVTQAAYEAPHYTWDLSTDQTATATATEMTWTSNFATMAVEKYNASTATNNYYPGTPNQSYTSTRFYKNSKLTIAPVAGYAITGVVFTATTESYATAFEGSSWTNASAVANGTTITVTPTDGLNDIVAVIGGTCGFTAVSVYYVEDNTPSITANNVEIAYDATSGEIAYTLNNPAANGSLSVSENVEWISNATLSTTESKVTFDCQANPNSTSREGVVTITYTYGTESIHKDVTVTQAGNPNYTMTIAEVRAQGTGDVTTQGIVTSCVGTTGYIQDATAAICVYGEALTVGDEIRVSGSLTTYKGLLELTSPTVTVLSSGNTVTPVVKTIAEINADDPTSSTSIQGLYVTIEGATVTVIDGQNTTIAQGDNTIVVRGISGVEYAVNDILTLNGNIGCFNVAQIANPQNIQVQPAPVAPSVTIADATVNVTAEGGNGTIDVTYTNIDPNDIDPEAQFFASDGETPATYNWITVTFNAENNAVYNVEANDGEARTAYFKVYEQSEGIYSNLVTVNQAAPVVPPTPGNWVQTNLADLTTTDIFVIVGDNGATYAMANDNGTQSAPAAIAVTVANGTLSGEIATNIQWNISGNATDGYTFYPNGETETWLYCTNTNDGVRVGTGNANHFTLDATSGYLTTSETTDQRYLGIYNSQDWRCYKNTTGNIANQTFAFYKKVTGPIVAKPTFEPEGGVYTSTQTVTINCTTEGATIHYKLTENGTWQDYSTAISVTETTTIWAYATKEGMADSPVASATYTLNLPVPTITVAPTLIEATTAETEGYLTMTLDNIVITETGGGMFDYIICDEEGAALPDPSIVEAWLALDFPYDNNVCSVYYVVSENTTTTARSAYFKIYGLGDDGTTEAYSNIVHVTQEGLTPTYMVSFNLDGGTFIPNADFTDDIVEKEAGTYALPSATKSGINFAGWLLDGTQTIYAAGADYEVTGDVSFTAQWSNALTGTIYFGSASGSTAINGTSVSGDDNLNNTWTITTVMETESFTQNASYSQIGASSKPATSITFTTTLPTDVLISSFSAKFGGFSGTAGNITLKVGETTVGTGALNATTDVIVNNNQNVFGKVLTVTVTDISKGVKAYYISYSYEASTDPMINAPASIDLASDATAGEIEYSISNPVSGKNLTATTTTSWISGITVTDEKVTFATTANTETTERQGTITLSYEGAADKDVTIIQAAYVAPFAPALYLKANSITPGAHYIIVGFNGSDAYAMGEQRSNNRGAVIVSEDESIATVINEDVYDFVIESSDEYYSIFDARNNGYLYAASSGGNQLKTENELSANSKWEISFDATTGEASVVATLSTNRNIMQFNSGSTIFSCYGSASQKPVYLYVKSNLVPSNSNTNVAGYGTSTTDGYRLIASPVTVNPATTGMTTGNFDLYYFNESVSSEWMNYKEEHFNLVPGKGYLYANSATVELTFTGAPFEGDGKVQLDYTDGATFAGWNLIGNPYATNATLDKPYYRLNPEGNALLSETETTAVAPMEGMFVKATEAGQIATFTAQTRNTESKAIAQANIMVKGNNGNIVDNAIIRFDEGETLEKFQLKDNSTKVYFSENGQDFAIIRANGQNEMPVNFKAEGNGTFNISFTCQDVEFNYLHLIDNMTGNDVDLLVNPSYTFDARYTDYASRFKLVFATGNNDSESNFGFISNGNLMILGIDGEATLQMIDVTGRILSSETFSGSYNKAINAAQGVYMIRLIQGENVRTQKIVVK